MAERIHVLLDRVEKERFRRVAEREGKSLSEWLRDAARARLAAVEVAESLDTEEALRAFFDACDHREIGREPDWDEHRAVIARSAASGAAET